VNKLTQLVVLSLEPWNEVWRRNQLMIDALLACRSDLGVLFVEPPAPAARLMLQGQLPRTEVSNAPGRDAVNILRPIEWVPDRWTPYAPSNRDYGIRKRASELGFDRPVLWVNNHSLARFAIRTGWPIVYDITDDWLLLGRSAPKRRRAKLDDELLLRSAETVTVCSSVLASSRDSRRPIVVVPNGVDPLHFAKGAPRPQDLPKGPTAVYVGTLHDERLDVQLACRMADELSHVKFVYVGPDSLQATSRSSLMQRDNVYLLGPRDYLDIPSYYQHADVVIVPHLVTPFTESLDPIKAREILAVGTPTVSTAIAGFRHLGPPVRVAQADQFAKAVIAALEDSDRQPPPTNLTTWADAAERFGAVLEAAAGASARPMRSPQFGHRLASDPADRRRPRVAFLTSSDFAGQGGIHRYTSELLAELIRRDDVEMVPVASPKGAERLRQRFPNLNQIIILPGRSVISRSLKERYLLNKQLRQAKVDLVHATKHIVPHRVGCPTVLTVHDLFVFTRTKEYSLARQLLLPTIYRRSLAEADRVITVSDAIRQQLSASRLIADDRVDVVLEAPASALTSAVPEPVASLAHRQFALCVCDLSPHKNIELLLRIWEEVNRRTGLILAIVGPDRMRSSGLRRRLGELESAGMVVRTGFISNGSVRWCYEHAEVVLVPSFEEGFGLPVVEALQFHARLITSSDPALLEVSGDHTRHIDAADDGAWIDAIVEIYGTADGTRVDHLVSWREIADRTVDVYVRTLLQANPSMQAPASD